MTREAIAALSDADLDQVGTWALDEKQERTSRRKQETIARIRDLAAGVGIPIKIGGMRGRPAKSAPEAHRNRGLIAGSGNETQSVLDPVKTASPRNIKQQ